MSYPPPPIPYSSTPPYGPAAGNAPAKRAGTLMFVLGPLAVLLGGCGAGFAAAFNHLPPSPEMDQLKSQLTQTSGRPLDQLLPAAIANGIVTLLVGAALIGLALFVRRGRRGAIIATIVVAGLVVLVQSLGLLLSLAQMTSPAGLSGGCAAVISLAAFALLLTWLVGALRGGPAAAAAVDYQRYVAQWQQQQQYAAPPPPPTGLGYGVPPGPAQPRPPSLPGDGPLG